MLTNPVVQGKRVRGLAHLLDWLEDFPGADWQQRWLASGAESLGAQWRRAPLHWLTHRGRRSTWLPSELSNGMKVLICADVIRPSLEWLVSVPSLKGDLAPDLAVGSGRQMVMYPFGAPEPPWLRGPSTRPRTNTEEVQ
ncbi:hypothetical protein J2S46_000410 [Kitasatospora herbaricolor]|uniref:hypothetical protein n=1 Tax=Kitasatospora herbaricolor TaxID=68217 RepID=UPI0027908F30|nr:hypothetical protein [Kitasatospora herbaricolor]MDQ0305854.1 hypothetical protein [Kitasatospora herbaricolor]